MHPLQWPLPRHTRALKLGCKGWPCKGGSWYKKILFEASLPQCRAAHCETCACLLWQWVVSTLPVREWCSMGLRSRLGLCYAQSLVAMQVQVAQCRLLIYL